jgi:hypothetical protein
MSSTVKSLALVIVTAFVVGSCARKAPVTAPPPPPPAPTAAIAPIETVLPVPTVTTAGPKGIYPDPKRTPGALNPNISQANISQNICNPNWSTKSIRPPATYTTALKKKQMTAWGLGGTPADYEEDHLISLELGGNPTSEQNLWPEAYNPKPGAKEKDTVENTLHKEVCVGVVTLRQAQDIIRSDWYACYVSIQKHQPCK